MLNQILAIKNMTPHSREYYISYFSSFTRYFLFIDSKRHFVNQHIMLKSSVENITVGDKEKLLIAETFMERELP